MVLIKRKIGYLSIQLVLKKEWRRVLHCVTQLNFVRVSAMEMVKLWLLLALLIAPKKSAGAEFPPTCNRIECPSFDVIETGDGYEIRRYDSAVWASTAPIQDISLHEATRRGFLQ